MTRYGSAIIDLPLSYSNSGRKSSASQKYPTMSMSEFETLPVDDLMHETDAVIALWRTATHGEELYRLLRIWNFEPVTEMYWVKITGQPIVGDTTVRFRPQYGIGYWFRGCVEPIIIARRPGGRAHRSQFVGLLSQNAAHSRKPDSLHEYVESALPGPYLELFARRPRPGWTCLGNEIDGLDIGTSVQKLIDGRA